MFSPSTALEYITPGWWGHLSSDAQENELITALPIKLLVASKWKELSWISFMIKELLVWMCVNVITLTAAIVGCYINASHFALLWPLMLIYFPQSGIWISPENTHNLYGMKLKFNWTNETAKLRVLAALVDLYGCCQALKHFELNASFSMLTC